MSLLKQVARQTNYSPSENEAKRISLVSWSPHKQLERDLPGRQLADPSTFHFIYLLTYLLRGNLAIIVAIDRKREHRYPPVERNVNFSMAHWCPWSSDDSLSDLSLAKPRQTTFCDLLAENVREQRTVPSVLPLIIHDRSHPRAWCRGESVSILIVPLPCFLRRHHPRASPPSLQVGEAK